MERKLTTQEQANEFLLDWHRFPLDYWWRKKYNVAFGSPKHRAINFIDVYLEYCEMLLVISQNENSADSEEDDYPESNNRKAVDMTQKEIDKDFEEIDLTDFDKK